MLSVTVVLDLLLALLIVAWPLLRSLRAATGPTDLLVPATGPPDGGDPERIGARRPFRWIRRPAALFGAVLVSLPMLVGLGAGTALADPPAPAQPTPHVKIVVIGDSFTSGEGADPSTYAGATVKGSKGQLERKIDPAHLSSNAPAQQAIEALRAQYPNVTFDVKYVAVSGATRDSMRQPSGAPPFQHPSQLSEVAGANIVIVGVGGNDIGFAGWIKSVLSANIGPGSAMDAVLAWQKLMNQLRDGGKDSYIAKQTEFYKEIGEKIDRNGTVITLGYPRILAEHPGGLISDRLARLSNQLALTLSAANMLATENAQNQVGPHFNFADTTDALDGHLIGDRQPGVHGIDMSNPNGSYHPNPLGQRLIAERLRSTIERAIRWEQTRQSASPAGQPPAGSDRTAPAVPAQPPAAPRRPDQPRRPTGPAQLPATQPQQPGQDGSASGQPRATTGAPPRPGTDRTPAGSRRPTAQPPTGGSPGSTRPPTGSSPAPGRSGAVSRPPAAAGGGQTASAAGTGQAPAAPGGGQAPATAGTGQAPAAAGTGQAPAAAGSGQAPAAAGTGRAPSAASGGRAPAAAGGVQTPPTRTQTASLQPPAARAPLAPVGGGGAPPQPPSPAGVLPPPPAVGQAPAPPGDGIPPRLGAAQPPFAPSSGGKPPSPPADNPPPAGSQNPPAADAAAPNPAGADQAAQPAPPADAAAPPVEAPAPPPPVEVPAPAPPPVEVPAPAPPAVEVPAPAPPPVGVPAPAPPPVEVPAPPPILIDPGPPPIPPPVIDPIPPPQIAPVPVPAPPPVVSDVPSIFDPPSSIFDPPPAVADLGGGLESGGDSGGGEG